MNSADREATLSYLRDELRERESEVAELEIQLVEGKRNLELVRQTLKLLSPPSSSDIGDSPDSFILRVGSTCLEYGTFNIPKALGHRLTEQGTITLMAEAGNGVQHSLDADIRYYKGRGGQPRVVGRRPLKEYFHHITNNEATNGVKVEIISPIELKLSPASSRRDEEEGN